MFFVTENVPPWSQAFDPHELSYCRNRLFHGSPSFQNSAVTVNVSLTLNQPCVFFFGVVIDFDVVQAPAIQSILAISSHA